MLKNLLRPKWQHNDATVRRRTVEEEDLDSETLLGLCKSDPDSGVRGAAIARLQDLRMMVTVARERGEPVDPELPSRLLELILDADPETAPHDPELLRQCFRLCSDESQRRSLLLDAPYVELRRMAAETISDAAELAKAAAEDKSSEVRRAALLRIDDEETLGQLAKNLRGKDKTNAKLAEEKHSGLQEQRQRMERREELLEALRGFTEDAAPFEESEIEAHFEEWVGLSQDVETLQRSRFEAIQAALQPKLVAHRKHLEEQNEWQALRKRMLQDLRRSVEQPTETDPAEAERELHALKARWQALPPLANSALQERLEEEFTEALRRALDASRTKRKELQLQHRLEATIADLEKRLQQNTVSPKLVKKTREGVAALISGIQDKQTYDKPLQQIRNLLDKLAARLAAQREQEKAWQIKIKGHIEALEASLQAKTLKPALTAHKKAHELLVAAGEPRPPLLKPLEDRLRHSEPALRELKEWRNWGTDHAREELIKEADALAESPPKDVEKLAKTLQDLRSRWTALGPLTPGGKAYWEKFDEACARAYAPVQAKRETEAETRRKNLVQRQELCARLEHLYSDTNWEEADWRAVDKAIGEAHRNWRKAGGVTHKAWPEVRKRFDLAVKTLDNRLQPEREANFRFRQGLVRKAEALAQEEDNRSAVGASRELKKEWQITVHSHNRKEQELWRAFNAALDSVFQQERNARDKFIASLGENQREAENLCEQLETLAKGEDEYVRSNRSEMKQIAERFSALANLPRQSQRQLESRFDQAQKAFKKRLRNADDALHQAQLQKLYSLHRLAVKTENVALGNKTDPASAGSLEVNWSAAEKPQGEKQTLLEIETRFQRALAVVKGEQSVETLGDCGTSLAEKERICIDLELLLGVDSPPAAQSQRMRRQMEILKSAMQGGDPNTPDRIRELKLAYLASGPVDPEVESELESRFAAVFGF